MRVSAVFALTTLLCGGLAGCAGSPAAGSGCSYYTSFGVYPGSAVVDHSASAPGNQQKFTASETPAGTGTGCVLPALSRSATPDWKSSDPLNVTVSSAKDETNGTATCTGMTGGPVTLTATSTDKTQPASASVQLTCK